MQLIGITGRKGSGKDTVTNFLLEQYPNTIAMKFAEPVKQIVCCLTGCDRLSLEDEDFKNSNLPQPLLNNAFNAKTYRELLQIVGTDLFRNQFLGDIWINVLHSTLPSDKHVIISDVRFPNEADFIHSNGGKVIKLTRFNDTKPLHVSECIDKVESDFIIDNSDGDLTKLKENILKLKLF